MKLCNGCMNLIDERVKICPICNHKQKLDADFWKFRNLKEGTVLQGRYTIGKRLGFGGFGITYYAWDQKLQIPVAIKEYFPVGYAVRKADTEDVTVFSFEMAEEYENGLNLFLIEAQNLAKLHQMEGVVHIFDCLIENNTGYIVMEYLQGQNLEEYIRKKGILKYEEAIPMVLRLLTILDALHKQNLIHRDISPDNIFLLEDGRIKLIDFGSARFFLFSMAGSYSAPILKPNYAPVELYLREEDQGPWSDVYGVGAVFYYMITGKRPIDAFKRLPEERLPLPSKEGADISQAAEAVLMKSLAVKKEDRYLSAEEFRKALLSCKQRKGVLRRLFAWKKDAAGTKEKQNR